MVAAALLSLYVVWGSSYLAIRFALEGFPPLLMAGLRFLAAGGALYVFLRLRGAPPPRPPEWKGAAVIGIILLVGGTGGVTLSEKWVASGLASLAVAAVPLWAALFGLLAGQRLRRREMVGLALGFGGVIILNLEGDFRAHPQGFAILLLATLAWSFGSVWSRRWTMPPGLMSAAAQNLAAGLFIVPAGLLAGERFPGTLAWRPVLALAYLVLFGSIVGFSAYLFLLARVRPSVATSYAYVNPAVAVLLGLTVGGETVSATGLLAMVVIIAGVMLVLLGHRG